MYDEYGEVIVEDDGYYYSPHGTEVLPFLGFEFYTLSDNLKSNLKYLVNRWCVYFIPETAV